jgi:hypothetical protein
MVSVYKPLPYIERIGANEGQETYLTRIHLTPFRWWPKILPRIYLHFFGRPDEDRELHDHPWGFTTIVLWGGYDEISHVMNYRPFEPSGEIRQDCLGFLSIRRRQATHAHRITRLHTKHVVTLVLRDHSRQRTWGFWCDQGIASRVWAWVPWHQYMVAKNLLDPVTQRDEVENY